MKKNLVAMGVAAALVVPMTAQALDGGNDHNVEIYGRFQMELANVDSGLSGSDNDPRYLVDDKMGRWGIFATEKLGNGWTAFGRFEWLESTDDADSESDRDSYVGLKGPWGLFLAGRNGSAYKVTGGVKADPFVATTLEARNGGGMSSGAFGQTSFVENVIVYGSPTWNGFNFLVSYNPENSDERDPVEGFYSVGAQYKNGPLWLWAGLSDQNDNKGPGDEDKDRWKVGGSYTFGNHTLRAQYEEADGYDDGFGDGDRPLSNIGLARFEGEDAEFLWVAYLFKMGNNELMLSYGMEEYDLAGGGEDENEVLTIGARHRMSKTFSIFGGWKHWEIDLDAASPTAFAGEDDEVDLLTIGMRKDFKI